MLKYCLFKSKKGISFGSCCEGYSAKFSNKTSSFGTVLKYFAGEPNTIVNGGTSLVTTDPAPTTASLPIVISGRIIEFNPTLAPDLIVTPFLCLNLSSVLPIHLSLEVDTLGPIKTLSSKVQ